jgi:hypothetical protein
MTMMDEAADFVYDPVQSRQARPPGTEYRGGGEAAMLPFKAHGIVRLFSVPSAGRAHLFVAAAACALARLDSAA